MRSQISSRQVMSNSCSNNSNESSSNGSNFRHGKPSSSAQQASANSGYSADGSANATAPPIFIDFLERNGSPTQGDDNHIGQSRNNRRKAIELSFTASRAMEDLKKGGLPIPTIRTEDARDLEGCKIDMSKVKLVMAQAVKESPFLMDRDPHFKVIPNSAHEYDRLFAATYQSYEKNDSSSGTQWDSSTSSVTSSESDDAASMPPPALVVPPLLEDALKANEEAMKNGDARRAGSKRKRPLSSEVSAAKAAKLHHITMNDALEACSEARVVTLSFHPYIVVHVNTAYTRLTGYSSAKVLGRPLQDCLGSACSKDWMKIRAVPHPIAALHERLTPIRTKGNNKHYACKCHAILVGPQLEGKKEVDTSTVTHYAVSFLPVPSIRKSLLADPSDKTVKTSSPAPPRADHPRQVMG